MASGHSESALDELTRLSQQFKKQEHEATRREKESARQKKRTQDTIGELRDFSISMAVRQLQLVANPQTIKQVNALKSKQGTAELRKLIGNLAYDLEKRIRIIAVAQPDAKPLERSINTLTILLQLLFTLE